MPKTTKGGTPNKSELPSTLERSNAKAQYTFAKVHDSGTPKAMVASTTTGQPQRYLRDLDFPANRRACLMRPTAMAATTKLSARCGGLRQGNRRPGPIFDELGEKRGA
jgi:hypothetical protein